MDFGSARLYEIELWNSAGLRVADISTLAFNRSLSLKRNDTGTFTFSLNLVKWESYCAGIGVQPRTLLAAYVTDLKVKRGGQYLYGFQVVNVAYDLAQEFTVNVTCSTYHSFFKDRYSSNIYTGIEATSIATDLLTTTQAQTNGSFGVTIAAGQYATGVLRDRTFQRDNILLKIQELTQLIDGRFDFDFSWDKQFYTYAKIGSRRRDLSLIYGGPGSNISGFALDSSGINLFNKIYGVGSGFGADQLVSIQADSMSQLSYYLREKISQFNSVTIQATLDQNTSADLTLSKDILELPQIIITGKELYGAPFISVGDRIPVSVQNHPALSEINGLYRVEQLDITIDENDFESQIKLTFDSYGVDPNE